MKRQANKTAVLIFVRTELEEVRAKKWYSHAGYQNDLKLARLLNRQVEEVARSSDLPTYTINSKNQVGNTFAERFTNAIQTVFSLGYEGVIAIGNDCLNLTAQHLRIAQNLMDQNKFVIGPTLDGGAYLIGIRKELFLADQFLKMPWQQADLLCALKSYSDLHQHNYVLLNEEKDLDSAFDLKIILQQIYLKDLARKILFIVGYHVERIISFFYKPKNYLRLDQSFQRGPPIYLPL